MKEFINKVEIQGAVGSVKRSAYGDKSVERFSVVTDTTYSQGGMMIVDTTWFSVTRFVPTNSPEEIKKGDWVHVDGRFHTPYGAIR